MSNGLEQLLVNNIGSVITAGGFIYYLSCRDKLMQERHKEFNTVVTNHLDHSNKVIQDNSKAQKKLAVELQKLSTAIKNNNK